MTKFFLFFLSFGLIAAGIFPFYANFFVAWRPGMLKFFVLGCVFAGIFVGVGNFFVFRGILNGLRSIVAEVANIRQARQLQPISIDNDLYNSFVNRFIELVRELLTNQQLIKNLGRELAEGIDTIRMVIEATEQIARDVTTRTHTTVVNTTIGKQQITDTFDGCKRVQVSLEHSIDKIHIFEKQFNDIAKAADTIASLSKQTDMLATNASITAARAGDSGKEFGVVAGEVKKLAYRSHEVTTTIGMHIESTKKVTREALSAIETASSEFTEHSQGFTVSLKHLLSINETANNTIAELNKVLDKLSALSALSSKVNKSAQAFF